MCGIVGFIGQEQAAPILLDGLAHLEYRGYDSAGIAVQKDGALHMIKASGHIDALAEKTQNGTLLPGTSGIGRSRRVSARRYNFLYKGTGNKSYRAGFFCSSCPRRFDGAGIL